MSGAFTSSKKKRDIAYVVASFLDRDRKYSVKEIEHLIRDNVKIDVLAIPGLAPDHLRLAMLENGFCNRDPKTNEMWLADSFRAAEDVHGPRLAELRRRANATPDEPQDCPLCGQTFRSATLYTHYVHKHARPEQWEEILDLYFGSV